MKNKNIIIVGTGIGGLSAGYWLRKKGFDVEMLELNDRPGGCMATLQRGRDTVDVGAQAFVSNNRYAIELLKDFGLYKKRRNISPKVHYKIKDGSSFVYNHNLPYLRPLGLMGNIRQFNFLFRHVIAGKRFPKYEIHKDIPAYDDINMREYLNKPSHESLHDFLVTPICMLENLGMPEWMNMYHFIHMLRNAMGTFFSLDGGNAQLAKKLAADLSISYESPVSQVVMEKGRVVGVEVEGSNQVKKADHVIVASGPITAAKILPDEMAAQKDFFKFTLCDPVTIPVFFLDRPLRREAWLYANDPRLKRTFMFAWDEYGKNPMSIPSGKSVVIGWSGHPMTRELVKKSDDEVLQQAGEDLGLCIPGFTDMVEDAQVFRHNSGAVRYPIGSYRKIIEFKKQAEDLKGISFVSSMFGGAYMEAAIRSGKAAVDRISRLS